MKNRVATDKEYKTKLEKVAKDIIDFLLIHGLWQDTCVYVNGKRFSDYDGEHYHYDSTPDDVFVEDNVNPRDYFEYAGDLLSISFEGPLYDILNYGWELDFNGKLEQKFSKLLEKHGYYYELGDAWNLTLVKM